MNAAEYRSEAERELREATRVGIEAANYHTQRALVLALLALAATAAQGPE